MNFRSTLGTFLILIAFTPCSSQSLLKSGPMVGYGEMTEVMLWVQLEGAGDVQYRYWEQGKKSSARTTRKTKATAEKSFIVHTLIDGLKEGRVFEYELIVNGKVIPRPYPLRFQTQPLWHWRKDPPAFTVAVGSCAYINDAADDRPGKPYGSDYEIFTALAEAKPDVMIWLGDNTYYREIDWTSVERMKYRYSHTRSLPELQPLLGSTHHYAIWDDHDYGPNDSDRSYRLRSEALGIFKLFWANHTYGTAETPGVFGRFEWGDVEFFLLDDRYHRTPNRVATNEEKRMFGTEQLRWLQEALVSSQAPFKVVCNGNQVLSPKVSYEALCNFPAEYTSLLSWIKNHTIPGVFFVSGDIHSTQLAKLDEPGFYPLYDLSSSSLTAGIYKPTDPVPAWFDTSRSVYEHNFCLLKFDGPRIDRRLTIECRNKDGKMLWTFEVKAGDLKVKK